jgi:hypothetical protein
VPEFRPIEIDGTVYDTPLSLTQGYRRGEMSLADATAGLVWWGWPPERIAKALTHPSGGPVRSSAPGRHAPAPAPAPGGTISGR